MVCANVRPQLKIGDVGGSVWFVVQFFAERKINATEKSTIPHLVLYGEGGCRNFEISKMSRGILMTDWKGRPQFADLVSPEERFFY